MLYETTLQMYSILFWLDNSYSCHRRGRRGRDRMVDGFHIITNVVSG